MTLIPLISCVLVLIIQLGCAAALPTFCAKVIFDPASLTCEVVQAVESCQENRLLTLTKPFRQQTRKLEQERDLSSLPQTHEVSFVQFFALTEKLVQQQINQKCSGGTQKLRESAFVSEGTEKDVVRKMVDSGKPDNRIDVVFMGDGYTQSQEELFFKDMTRLKNDMFTTSTFAEYLPLFNIWGLFRASRQSGLGVGGRPRDTAFGLYRSGTELRGIYCSKQSAARSACRAIGRDACDFPSLIANDEFYGGLGGEFTIATKSKTSGTMVLRHEMGHNFGDVGEEYDNGYVYSGANSARRLSSLTWKHWLTNPNVIREEKATKIASKYMWYNLQNGPYTLNFRSTGKYKRYNIQLSASGVDTQDSFSITLDGKPLPWKTNGLKDRSFYSWFNGTAGLSEGQHTIVVKGGGSFTGPIIKQLCSVRVYEYKGEDEFQMDDPTVVSAYPTWDYYNRKSYRPENERCLMRNMQSPKFCNVCKENMWLKFLARMQLIDRVEVTKGKIKLHAVLLAQLRPQNDLFLQSNPEVAKAEKYTVTWYKNGVKQHQHQDKFEILRADNTIDGAQEQWRVKLEFTTPTVRKDPNNFLTSEKEFRYP